MAKDSWRAASWLDKLRVWFAHPGWRPADVAARYPRPAYDPHRDFAKYDPPRSLALSIYCAVQFAALMAANSHFLAVLPRQPKAVNAAYFLFLAASLVCLGGVMENRRGFLLAETARLAVTGSIVAAAGNWFGGVTSAWEINAIVLFAAASLAGLWAATRPASMAQPA